MKNLFVLVFIVLGLFSYAQEISSDSEIVDFGQIQKGSEATSTFKFTNTGYAPLIISKATGSCGCTVPSYPKTPIAPGASGEIDVRFTAVNKLGPFSKTITIMSNAQSSARKIIRVKGEVVE